MHESIIVLMYEAVKNFYQLYTIVLYKNREATNYYEGSMHLML